MKDSANIKYYITNHIGYFSGINDEHFIASYSEDIRYAKFWNTLKEATDFFNKWKDTGVGLDGQIMTFRLIYKN